MTDANWDSMYSKQEEQRDLQKENEQYKKMFRKELNIEDRIQNKLHKLMNQNKPNLGSELPFFYLLEIDKEQKITCELIPANKYSLERGSASSLGENDHEYLYGICLTQKIVPEQNHAFKFNDLELVLTVYEGNIYPIK